MNQELVLDSTVQSNKQFVWWLYVFHGASLVLTLGMISWIPLIINYIKRDETIGTFLYSHHQWQIRSFWWYLVWMAIGGLLFATLIGIPLAALIWGGAWIWKAYRIIKGFLDLDANRPMPV